MTEEADEPVALPPELYDELVYLCFERGLPPLVPLNGVPSEPTGLNWSQEMRLSFARRAEGLPPRGVEDLKYWWILDGRPGPWPDIDRQILDEYAAWQRDGERAG